MADRLTQLQDLINQQAEHFCNAIGILQQFAPPARFSSGSQTAQEQKQEQQDYAHLFAVQIVRVARDIDALIDSLPTDESAIEVQMNNLRKLEHEDQTAAETLKEEVKLGEMVHEEIQKILTDIAEHELGIADRKMEK